MMLFFLWDGKQFRSLLDKTIASFIESPHTLIDELNFW